MSQGEDQSTEHDETMEVLWRISNDLRLIKNLHMLAWGLGAVAFLSYIASTT